MSDNKEAAPRGFTLRSLFANAEERRLRAGWRLLGYGVLLIISLFLAGSAAALLQAATDLPPVVDQALGAGWYLAAVLPATWLARRLLDRRPFLDLGMHARPGWCLDLLFGIALGGLLMAAVFGTEWALGWLRIDSFAWQAAAWPAMLRSLAGALFLYIIVALNEETAIRGYLLQNLAQGLNTVWAILISSLLFGLLHAANPFATWTSALYLVIAGVFLAAGYLATGSLWLPIGLHLGWNFFQGTVFGFPVSGTGGFHLVSQTVAGPQWATGGHFGPEAGLTGPAAMLLGTILIWLWGRRVAARRPKDGDSLAVAAVQSDEAG
jgi:membrane protease YdiL (CAAX protease family)